MININLCEFAKSYNDYLIEQHDLVSKYTGQSNGNLLISSNSLSNKFNKENPIIFTDEQQKLIKELENFLNDSEHDVFLLKGYAGTGKSTLLILLENYFSMVDDGVFCFMFAPTGKSSLVIDRKNGKHCCQTIHKGIYQTEILKSIRGVNFDFDKNSTLKSSKTNDDGRMFESLPQSEKNRNKKCLPLNQNNCSENDFAVYIFDEASLISNCYSEMTNFVFGSGCLLDDIFSYIDPKKSKKHRRKIVFCGDPAQLWPVNMNFSPALNANYIKSRYGVAVTTYELKEILRQKSDSFILKNATKIREYIRGSVYQKPTIEYGKDFFEIKANINISYTDLDKKSVENIPQHIKNSEYYRTDINDSLIRAYIVSCKGKLNNHTEIICYSNREAFILNQKLRTYFHGVPNMPICANDLVIIMQNAYVENDIFLSNGEFGLVTDVFDESYEFNESIVFNDDNISNIIKSSYVRYSTRSDNKIVADVKLVIRKVRIKRKNSYGDIISFDVWILENFLYSNEKNMTIAEQKAYERIIVKTNSILNNVNSSFNEINKHYEITDKHLALVGAIKIRFGYAITCHKSQGSEWDDVFVYCPSIEHMSNNEETLHWLYTAITRAKKNLYIINPPNFSAFSNVKVLKNNINENIGELNCNIVEPKNPINPNRQDFSNIINQFNKKQTSNGVSELLDLEVKECNKNNNVVPLLCIESNEDIMNFDSLCRKFGFKSDSIIGWILKLVLQITDFYNLKLLTVENKQYCERFFLCDQSGEKELTIDIFYNKKQEISSVNCVKDNNFQYNIIKEKFEQLVHKKYFLENTSKQNIINDPYLIPIIDEIKNMCNPINVHCSLTEHKNYTLFMNFARLYEDKITHSKIEEQADCLIYYNKNYIVTNLYVRNTNSNQLKTDLENIFCNNLKEDM